MALAAEHTLQVPKMQPGIMNLCMQPPAALLQLVNASTGKIMPYHKVAIKTGLSLDSLSENPAPQPVFQAVWKQCASTQPGDQRAIIQRDVRLPCTHGCLRAVQTGRQADRELAMLGICHRAVEP